MPKSSLELGKTSVYNLRKRLRAEVEEHSNFQNHEDNEEEVQIPGTAEANITEESSSENDDSQDGHEENNAIDQRNEYAVHEDIDSEMSDESDGSDSSDQNEGNEAGNNPPLYDPLEDLQDDISNDGDDDDIRNYDNDENDDNRPLYNGAPITVAESMALILSLILNHQLTGSCVADLLHVLHLHCIAQGLRKLSLYRFRQYFSFSNAPVTKIYYCSNCMSLLDQNYNVCPECQERNRVSYFMKLNIIAQLKKILSRPGRYESLQYRFTREKMSINNIEDIYDGQLYQEEIRNGFLSNSNISFLWNSDGVPVFKSKKFSIWPLYLIINELPYKIRYKRENVVLAGLWFGPDKPDPNCFIHSYVEDFRKIHTGFNVQIPQREEPVYVRGKLLLGTCDLPAKSTFIKIKSFNGKYGCPVCEFTGETIRFPDGSHNFCYRYAEHFNKRTLKNMNNHAREAQRTGEAVFGVKSQTALRLIMPDFVRGMGIDLMHILSGIVKKLMTLHFDSKYSRHPFSLRLLLPVVDELLLSLHPPKFVHQMMRSLEETAFWKVSELKTWFFYYSIPVLKQFLRIEYFEHYLKLVTTLSYLNASSISDEMIDTAKELLKQFVRDFEQLYGIEFCSINVHLLLHLADCVRELGLLWAYACFPLEDLNGQILQNIHGTRYVDTQVCKFHWQYLCASRKLQSLPEGTVKDFCLRKRRKYLKITDRIGDHCLVVGSLVDHINGQELVVQGLRVSGVIGQIRTNVCGDASHAIGQKPSTSQQPSTWLCAQRAGARCICERLRYRSVVSTVSSSTHHVDLYAAS
ncbi:uncharacterized protein [Temnothorax longispinosus]|uniref:uncharacterized protein n=1 Tax=Temnothorax longispinosus TaxID=300112 RepID=UPI003A99492A